MSFLYSNFPPVRTNRLTYSQAFRDLLKLSEEINIATGYISTDSLVDLASVIEANGKPRLNLCVGMHFFDGVTPTQKEALNKLNEVLLSKELGGVYINVSFPYHGKIVSFSAEDQILASIVGSSNLSNIVVGGPRQYEVDFMFEGGIDESREAKEFIATLIEKSSKPLNEVDLRVIVEKNELLNDQYGVEQATTDEINEATDNLSEFKFELPLKADETPGSNINKHFGKGRENVQGFVTPRSWYEVELIVPRSITTLPGYPQADSYGDGGCFTVLTDDGWKFDCKVSGTNSKNICSDGDMKILGKWLKGRLERAGILKPGERVTDDMLERYGRNTITMTKVAGQDSLWFFDFGVNN